MTSSGVRTLGDAIPILAAYGWWRTTGSTRAGRRLIEALASPDEDSRMLAGTLLGRAGHRAESLLLKALERRQALPTVLLLLGDLGDPRLRPRLEPFLDDPDPGVARAARDALRHLGR